jgi:hypothetical protein
MKIRAGLTTMVILFGFGPAATVAAQNSNSSRATRGQAIPAAVCKQTGGSESLDFYFGRIRNSSLTAGTVECPVWRGREYSKSNSKVGVHLMVVDRHPQLNITCVIFNFDDHSTLPSYNWDSDRTSGAPNEPQGLTLGPRDRMGYGSSLIRCTLPGVDLNSEIFGVSEIVSFQPFDENDEER